MVYHEFSECDEIAEHLPIVGINSFSDALRVVEAALPDESATMQSNIAESLYNRSIAR